MFRFIVLCFTFLLSTYVLSDAQSASPVYTPLCGNGGFSATYTCNQVVSTYTTSGAISNGDMLSIINSASAVTMTLGSGTYDTQLLQIKRYGAGAVTINASIDGNPSGVITMTSASYKENISLRWSAALATWLLQ